MLTSQDIEIAVASHFNPRVNLIVPNVYWGWGLRHEADMIIVRPSGYCDEVEIKVTAADIRADRRKPYSHWESSKIARVWFAVPEVLAQNPDIPEPAGILAICERKGFYQDSKLEWSRIEVEVRRPARLIEKDRRRTLTTAERLKLAELGTMRIWELKKSLQRCRTEKR